MRRPGVAGVDREALARFRVGFANRTLGYRLAAKRTVEGAELRGRLQTLGVFRSSGHEHFNGSVVIPVFDAAGRVVEMYGRKVRDDLRAGTAKHLYLPGPHAGVWNRQGLTERGRQWCWTRRHTHGADWWA